MALVNGNFVRGMYGRGRCECGGVGCIRCRGVGRSLSRVLSGRVNSRGILRRGGNGLRVDPVWEEVAVANVVSDGRFYLFVG
jgi:hypothetical protein